jgi:hypothetical protein
MWLSKADKRALVGEATRLASVFASELINDPNLSSAIAERIESIPLRSQVAAIINSVLVFLAARLVAGQGNARHLGSAVKEEFDAQKDELRRLILLAWYAELNFPDERELIKRLTQESKSVTTLGVLQFWLYDKLIEAMSFKNPKAKLYEDALRAAINMRLKMINRDVPGYQIKAETDKVIQAARREGTRQYKRDKGVVSRSKAGDAS